jgi:hypothetical protein
MIRRIKRRRYILAKIEKVLKRGGGVYVVGYWVEGETYEDDAVDYDMKKCALAADLMCGDLTLS